MISTFLKRVFDNETEYTYLTKIYDSKEIGYTQQVKIFKINYDILSNINK